MARMVAVNADPNVLNPDHSTKNMHLAPDCRQLSSTKTLLKKNPDLAKLLKVTTFTANRDALEKRGSFALLENAVSGLRNRFPQFSAKQVISVRQAIVLLVLLQLLAGLSFFASGLVLTTLHLVASLFYFGCIALRLFSALNFDLTARLPAGQGQRVDRSADASLPVYSVLVALYHESQQVDDLVDALSQLDWPKENLEIRLICEADDQPTIDAVRHAIARTRNPHFSLNIVPVSLPRTKPKALNYVFPLCRGEFLVIYDAEDRPDALQLREAYETFQNGPPQLACLQAPLVILNHHESWLARMFAIEYASLFDGLLPALAKTKAPLPLGGTSNHFKRAVLENIGGWDPYNVTEDADIGIRLARAGCRIGTLRQPTYEEAPTTYSVWLKQRTRWFKGWYQTWLVHMRHPLHLARDLGAGGTLVFHLLVTGMVVSALVHPILLYFVAVRLFDFSTQGFAVFNEPLVVMDLTTILCGYLFFAALGWQTLSVRGMTHLRPMLWTVPAYWMLLSIAAWRALWHLITRPHEWEKTPHRLRSHRE